LTGSQIHEIRREAAKTAEVWSGDPGIDMLGLIRTHSSPDATMQVPLSPEAKDELRREIGERTPALSHFRGRIRRLERVADVGDAVECVEPERRSERDGDGGEDPPEDALEPGGAAIFWNAVLPADEALQFLLGGLADGSRGGRFGLFDHLRAQR